MTLRQRFLGAAFWLAGSDFLLTVFGMGVMLILVGNTVYFLNRRSRRPS